MSQDRIMVVPTRMALTVLKQKFSAATKGHLLLKKKADGLMKRFRGILKDLRDSKQSMGGYMRKAHVSLGRAKYYAGDNLPHMVIESTDVATYKLRLGTENIVGVRLPVFEPWVQGSSKEFTGMGQGGQAIKVSRELYTKALESLVAIASLQTTFITLDEIIKITNRRVNAIEYVIKPKLQNTIAFVDVELEEAEREEIFRLKKIASNKKKDLERKIKEGKISEAQAAELLQSTPTLEPKGHFTQDEDLFN